ncbi:MAG: hypothetical protein ACXWCS_14310 [Burkholderiales bacterium]
MKSDLCLRWLHNNGWTPQDQCACGKTDYPAQILRHCRGCAEIIDCDQDDPENWCGPCWDRHREIQVEQERDRYKTALESIVARASTDCCANGRGCCTCNCDDYARAALAPASTEEP